MPAPVFVCRHALPFIEKQLSLLTREALANESRSNEILMKDTFFWFAVLVIGLLGFAFYQLVLWLQKLCAHWGFCKWKLPTGQVANLQAAVDLIESRQAELAPYGLTQLEAGKQAMKAALDESSGAFVRDRAYQSVFVFLKQAVDGSAPDLRRSVYALLGSPAV